MSCDPVTITLLIKCDEKINSSQISLHYINYCNTDFLQNSIIATLREIFEGAQLANAICKHSINIIFMHFTNSITNIS